ncbi:MAG: retropepsin-like aspartic protease family protein [Sulfuricaulis sp.]
MRSLSIKIILAAILIFFVSGAGAVEDISLMALYGDKAIIIVDGVRHVLKSGEVSPEGIKLLSTDTQDENAQIEVNGKPEVLTLSVVRSSFASRGRGRVTLYPEANGHFYSDGIINGVTVRFLVDTGATGIVLSSDVADQVGIDYKRFGHTGYVHTASGVVVAYFLSLDSVTVGNITEYNVKAAVLEGSDPSPGLLGMSFLGQLDMKRDDTKMQLIER